MIIKICGIASEEIAAGAKDCGADLIGFVFAESRRRITPAAAAKIARRIAGIGKVGVFVNQPLREVREIADLCRLDYVQLHGGESPEYCRQLKLPVIKAVWFGSSFNLSAVEAYDVDWLLLDSFVPGQSGGTGVSFDWPRTAEIVRRLRRPFLVAGGLMPENVAEAVRILRPGGVDVSSGVETDGTKDGGKIRRFIAAARAAEEEGPNA